MQDLSHEFDRTIATAIARGLRPGPWRAEIERRFIAARFAGDEEACCTILDEWRARIEAAESESRAALDEERRAAHDAACRQAAARLSPREVIEAVERNNWHRLSLRADGAIIVSGGPPEDEVLRTALAIRTLLAAREEWSMAVPPTP
jgi:hypothetical protein